MKYLLQAARHPQRGDWWPLRPFQRHSLVLLIAGLVYVASGVLFFLDGPSPDRAAAIGWTFNVFPYKAWGVVWIATGVLALLSSRWPPASKTWGYSALTSLAIGWGSTYLVGVVVFGAPIQLLAGPLVWLLVAFLWWAIAGLTNPDDLLAMTDTLVAHDPEGDAARFDDRRI